MVTLAMAAIIVTLSLPNLRSMVQDNRSATAGNTFVTALNLARTSAVQQSVPVSICPQTSSGTACSGNNNWSVGWIVFKDFNESGTIDQPSSGPKDQILRVFSKLTGNATLSVSPAATSLTYAPTGMLIDSSGASPTSDSVFTLKLPNCSGQSNRTITVNPQGRIASAAASC